MFIPILPMFKIMLHLETITEFKKKKILVNYVRLFFLNLITSFTNKKPNLICSVVKINIRPNLFNAFFKKNSNAINASIKKKNVAIFNSSNLCSFLHFRNTETWKQCINVMVLFSQTNYTFQILNVLHNKLSSIWFIVKVIF